VSELDSVTAEELRDRSADVLGRVEHQGERVGVTRYGKTVAVVVSPADANFLARWEQLAHPPGALQKLKTIDLQQPLDPNELCAWLRRLLMMVGRDSRESTGARAGTRAARRKRMKRSRESVVAGGEQALDRS
jgi:prevent-host-death family protein